jgi:hypothetical protein
VGGSVRPLVLTACFGGYDTLRPQAAQDIEVDWMAVVDRPLGVPWPWHPYILRPTDEHPRVGAKFHKLQPPVHGQADVVWIDANTEIISPSFVRRALAARRNGIAVWRHPQRDCIYAEAEASLRLAPEKYSVQPLLAQVESYRAEGHPARAGLYACGTVAWDWSQPAALALGTAWLNECLRWSYQDQLSLPVVLRRAGIKPGIFPAGQIERRGRGPLGNRWQLIHPHLSAA